MNIKRWMGMATLAAALCLTPGDDGHLFGQPDCRTCDQGLKAPPSGFSLSTIAPPLLSPQIEQAILMPAVLAAPNLAVPRPAPAHGHDANEFQEMPVPIIKVKVKAPACWETGKEMEYRIRIENVSSADAHHVVVRDTLPPSVRLLRASPLPHKRSPDLEWYWETLPGNGCADIVVAVMPIAVANVKNCVRVAYEHGQCVTTKVIGVPSDTPGGVRPPDSGGVIPPPPPFLDPREQIPPFGKKTALALSVPKDATVKVNEKQTLEYIVYNKGLIDAVNTGLFLEIPVDLDIDRLGLKGIPALTFPPFFNEIKDDPVRKPYVRIGLQLGTLKPGEERRIYVPVNPLRVGTFDILLKAKADTTEVEQANHQIKVVMFGPFGPPMTKRGGLHIQVADTDDPIMAGVGRTNYQIEVWNQGTDVVRDIQLVCRLSPQLRVAPDKPYRTRQDGEQTLIDLDPIPILAPEKKANITIALAAAEKVGQRRFEEARFEVQMQADILNERLGPVIVQENTTIMKEDAFLMSLRKRLRHER
jgi:uncharacterized repeat protein (TIGR01451 family)